DVHSCVLPSFPTRRSSDLAAGDGDAASGDRLVGGGVERRPALGHRLDELTRFEEGQRLLEKDVDVGATVSVVREEPGTGLVEHRLGLEDVVRDVGDLLGSAVLRIEVESENVALSGVAVEADSGRLGRQ